MNFSSFLNSRREACRALVAELGKSFSYVGVLGSDVKSSAIRVNRNTSDIGEGGAAECGFVVKMHNGRAFFEYSVESLKEYGYEIISLDRDFDDIFKTEYEIKFKSKGKNINHVIVKK